MAKDNKIDIEINAKGGPSLKRNTKEIKKQKQFLFLAMLLLKHRYN